MIDEKSPTVAGGAQHELTLHVATIVLPGQADTTSDADRLNAKLRSAEQDLKQAFIKYIEFGADLVATKARLRTRGAFKQLLDQLWCDERTARKFMLIARNTVLTNRMYTSALPASWDTNAELARFANKHGDHVLEHMIQQGTVNPRTTKKQVLEWLNGDRPEREQPSIDLIGSANNHLTAVRSLTKSERLEHLQAFARNLERLGVRMDVWLPDEVDEDDEADEADGPTLIEAEANEAEPEAEAPPHELSGLPDHIINKLVAAGITTVAQVREAGPDGLGAVRGIGTAALVTITGWLQSLDPEPEADNGGTQ